VLSAQVENVIRHQTTVGAQHRDHAASGTLLRHHTNSSLAAHFFGPARDQKLGIARFLDFQQQLQLEILRMEVGASPDPHALPVQFERQEPVEGCISELSFAKMLLQHSGLDERRQQRMLRRVKSHYAPRRAPAEVLVLFQACGRLTVGSVQGKAEGEPAAAAAQGLSLADVGAFFRLLTSIGDVDAALQFYRLAGAPVDRATLRHVARAVTRLQLPDQLVDAVFVLFDENRARRQPFPPAHSAKQLVLAQRTDS